jgi:hypothetical protein
MICVILHGLIGSCTQILETRAGKGSVIARRLLDPTVRLIETSEKRAALLRELLYISIEEYEIP